MPGRSHSFASRSPAGAALSACVSHVIYMPSLMRPPSTTMPQPAALRRRVVGALYLSAARSDAAAALRLFVCVSFCAMIARNRRYRQRSVMAQYDVIVIGAGNAALAASVSARGAGAEHVLVLEKAPEHDRGGNTHFSGGLFRFAFNQPGDLLRLVPKAREVEGFMEGIEAYPTDA